MNDLISRQAAIEAIYALHEDGEDGISSYLGITDVGSYPYLKDDYTEGLADCVSEIEDLPSAQQWTPCSERLPNEEIDEITEDYKEYLCVRYVGNERQVVSVYKFGKGAWWNGLFKVEEPFPVIAWQPLPEPYVEV